MNSPADILNNKPEHDLRNPAVMNLSDLISRCEYIKVQFGQGAVDEFLDDYAIGDDRARLVHAGDLTSKWQRMVRDKMESK